MRGFDKALEHVEDCNVKVSNVKRRVVNVTLLINLPSE